MTGRHKTKVWVNDGIWGWSCLCHASGAGWPSRDDARDEAAQHFWSNHDPGDLRRNGRRLMNALRVWWRHRNDPPAMLPDPVRWTTRCAGSEPMWFVGTLNLTEKHDGHGWQIEEVILDPEGGSPNLRLVRFDGAYRWRDDGFRGF
jgi:hypothetical protein